MINSKFFKDKLRSVVLWTHRHESVIQPAKIDINQLCAYTEYHLEDLLRALADRDKWGERVNDDDDDTID